MQARCPGHAQHAAVCSSVSTRMVVSGPLMRGTSTRRRGWRRCTADARRRAGRGARRSGACAASPAPSAACRQGRASASVSTAAGCAAGRSSPGKIARGRDQVALDRRCGSAPRSCPTDWAPPPRATRAGTRRRDTSRGFHVGAALYLSEQRIQRLLGLLLGAVAAAA